MCGARLKYQNHALHGKLDRAAPRSKTARARGCVLPLRTVRSRSFTGRVINWAPKPRQGPAVPPRVYSPRKQPWQEGRTTQAGRAASID